MLGVNRYEPEFIAHCRENIDRQVRAYSEVATAARTAGADAALDAFEPQFFNHMVVTLDAYFMHRLRVLEMKDGNPLNEVRLVAQAVITDGKLPFDKTIKWKPERSVLKYAIGDEVQVREDGFRALAAAFLDDLEKKFSG